MALTYEQIMQKPGKRLSLQITYTQNGTTTTINHDNIFNAKPYYNSQLVGTIMHGFECETTTELPKDTGITLSVTARYNSDTQTRIYGPYYVKESKYNADKRDYTNECYDSFLNTMVEYQPLEDDETLNIEFPISIYDFFIALVTKCGFTTNISKLPNGGNMIESDIYTGINYTYRNVFDDIGQATASCFYLDGTEVKIAELGGNESITGKNLFDKDTVQYLAGYIDTNQVVSYSTYRTIYIQCKPNTQYTIQRSVGTSSVYMAYTTTIPTLGGSCYGRVQGTTITTGNNAQYLLAQVYRSTADTNTWEEIISSIMLNEGSTALPYEPYENPNITIQDGTETSLVGCNIEGNSYQYKTKGKNLFIASAGSTSSGNLTLTKNADGSFTLNGTNGNSTYWYRLNSNFTLGAGTYTLSNSNGNVSSSSAIFYDDNHNFDYDGTYSHNISTKTFSSSVTIAPYIRVAANASLNNFTIYPMIESGSNYTGFEQYTGQLPSPNPNYPQSIDVVKGQNLFSDNFNNLFMRLSYNDTTKIYTATDSDTATYLQYKIQQWSGTSGSTFISGTQVNKGITSTGIYSFTSTIVDNAQYIRVGNNGASSEFSLLIPIKELGLNSGEKFTLSLELTDITIGATKFKNIQIEKGTSTSPYLPYNNIAINIKSQNLVDKLVTTPRSNGVTFSPDLKSVTVNYANSGDEYFKICDIESPTTKAYTLYFEASGVNANETPRYTIYGGGAYHILTNGINVVNVPSGATIQNSRLLLDDAYKTQYPNTATVTFTNFMLVEGTYTKETIGNYVPYSNITTPIDLQGNFIGRFGVTKDELNIDDLGNVILTKRIGKFVLNGTEDWGAIWSDARYVYMETIALPNSKRQSSASSRIICQSDYYTATHYDGGTGSIWNIRADDTIPYAISIHDVVGNANVGKIVVKNLDITTQAGMKNWFANHNTEVYYLLNEPYIVNLGKVDIKTNEGTNYITFLTGLDTRNTIEYRSSTPQITIDDDILMNKNIEFVGKVGPINSVIITRAEESDSIYKRDETAATWYEYKIADNQLMNNNDRDTFIDDIYHKLYGITYDIYDCELTGYGGFEPFTKIRIDTGDNQYNSYVFNNEMIFNQGFRENIFAEETEQTQSNYQVMDTTDKRVNEAYLILNKQNRTLTAQVERMDIIATHIDETNGNVTEVTTTTGFTFNADGLNIYTNDNTYNTQINNVGTYYKDGTTILSQTTKDGTKTKDLDIFGYNRYCEDDINDDPQFIAVKYMDANNEEGYGHFYNGV